MRALALIVGLSSLGCPAPTRPCLSREILNFRGSSTPPAPGAVAVVVGEDGENVRLSIVDSDENEHEIDFSTEGANFDSPSGTVVGVFGAANVGEGEGAIYVVLSDDRGLWFEGGSTLVLDEDDVGGGGSIGGRIVGGNETLERCADAADEGNIVDVIAIMDDGSHTVTDGPSDGTVDGLAFRAVSGGGFRESFADCGTREWGPGFHSFTETSGYLFRLFGE